MAIIQMDWPLSPDPKYGEMNANDICFDEGCYDEADDESDDESLYHIEQAILHEHRPGFVTLINKKPFDVLDTTMVSSIMGLLYTWDCAVCAAAIFDGETNITKMHAWTAWTSRVDNGPLHSAAGGGMCKMATLLLQRGFSADVRADFESLKAVLPLDVVLSKIQDTTRGALSRWRGRKAVKLVLELCEQSMHMQMKLETLRVIAQDTSDVKQVFFNYLKDGKMVEVAAMLLVARFRVLSSSPAEGEFRSISEMHDFVLNAKSQLSPTDTAKLVKMNETLLLLKIFVKIGSKLATLVRVDLTVFDADESSCSSAVAESLMQAAGFDVKPRRTCNEDELPSWVKEAALRGLGDKSGNTSRLPFSFVPKPPPYIQSTIRRLSSVSVSPLSSGSVPMPVNNPLLQHLVKKRASILGTMRNISRFR